MPSPQIKDWLAELGDGTAFRRRLLAVRRACGRYVEPWVVDIDGRIASVDGDPVARAQSLEIGKLIAAMHNLFLPITNMLLAAIARKEDEDAE